ncbi:MAG: S41 family peptidase [Ferruginibacter sp.]
MKKYLFCLLLLPAVSFAQQDFQRKAVLLRRFMELKHYKPLEWNDSSATLLFNKWIDRLDDEKLFFTSQDITALAAYKAKLPDEMKGKGWEFFDKSVALYKTRLQKTDSIIKVYLSKPVDLTKPDNLTWPNAGYAATESEREQRWQKYLKWQLLKDISDDAAADSMEASKLQAFFKDSEPAVREKNKKAELRYISGLLSTPATFIENLQDEYLNCIAWCYDPHSTYMNLKEKNEFQAAVSASEFSAGIDLEEDEKGDVKIDFMQPGGSAWRSGQLHKGDVITKVKIGSSEKDVSEISSEALANILSGNNPEDVTLTVKTAAGETKTVTLHKEKIEDDESVVKSYVLHGTKNIGYINLPGFYSRESEDVKTMADLKYDGCANDVSKEIVKLKKDTIAGLILDLRNNGGGNMWEAMQLAGIFIDIGPVASVKDRDGKVQFLKDPNRGTIYDGPLIVLVNGSSASASEFVSAALQDYNRAIIMGDKTYGKGSAQEVMPLDTGKVDANKKYEDFVKVTDEKFYRVNGGTTQWEGVHPDIELPGMYSSDMFKERSNASALLPDKNKEGMYMKAPALPVSMLAEKSRQRTAGNNYFKSVSKLLQWMEQYYKGRSIPLQWNSYYAQYTAASKMYEQLEDDEKGDALLRITNNQFDWNRIQQSGERSKEINNVYIYDIKKDEVIAEAYRVFMDWLNK